MLFFRVCVFEKTTIGLVSVNSLLFYSAPGPDHDDSFDMRYESMTD
jgi:hypothetical protein